MIALPEEMIAPGAAEIDLNVAANLGVAAVDVAAANPDAVAVDVAAANPGAVAVDVAAANLDAVAVDVAAADEIEIARTVRSKETNTASFVSSAIW